MPENRIRDIFIARIKKLMSLFEELKAVEHAQTKGTMREGYLKDFLREMLPPRFSPVSGFIADAYGNITPQLDMIFIDRSELPTVSLGGDTMIVPAEIALLTAEVKSRLTTDDLDQIKRQRGIYNTLTQFLSWQPISREHAIQRVPNIILAFKSDVAEETLRQWVSENYLIGLCVIEGICIYPSVFQGRRVDLNEILPEIRQ